MTTEAEFLNVLKLDKAIIYLFVDWSGPERISRFIVFKTLSDIGKIEIPLFKIDCSDQTKNYVVDWLIEQRENKKGFNYGGCGETLLMSKGKIINFIKNPGQLGPEKTTKKIHEWNTPFANSTLLKVKPTWWQKFFESD